MVLPVLLYGCKTWSLILREEHRVRVSEKRVLTRIFEQKRDEATSLCFVMPPFDVFRPLPM
jgi:hypothetical protein